ncbi:MAG: hypothetical protein JNN30_11670 [Rhodanobacteraceae bacterium]|nr:hypothetical protein [Rhodanobacteraceae bacterium]
MLPGTGAIPPFYFPTTTVLVDDHEEYLDVVPLMLDPMLRLRPFSSPRMALAALGSAGSRPVPGGGWLYRWKDRPSQTQELVALDVDSIHRIVYDPERFSEVSVLVVDYFMPEMDGVTFCKRLNNPLIGKILLTGRAEDSVAIEAFNSGVIDRFIRKSDPKAMAKLEVAIRELQQRYFERAGAFVAETLAMGRFSFLRDPAFRGVFDSVVATFQPIESYVVCNPTGVLMLDAWGVGRFLMVQTDDDLREQHDIAEDRGAPDTVLRALRSGSALPWFWSSGGFYSPQITNPTANLFPATAIQGENCYYFSLIDHLDPLQLTHVKSYRIWLREQDNIDIPPRAG